MDNILKPTELESAIMEWFIKNYPVLVFQMNNAKVIERDYTGVGFFITLKSSKDLPPLRLYGNPIEGPLIQSEQLSHGAGSILFIKDGYVDVLEIFAYGETFPENIQEFQLKESMKKQNIRL